jgi:RES domain-containing protein
VSKVASEQTELALGQVVTPGSVTLFRYTDYDVPFWARTNSRAGRWHRRGDAPTQYWSMTPEAAWAELIRAENLHSEAEVDLVRMPMWACRVPMVGLVDLTDIDVQHAQGITELEMVGDDWAPCQALGVKLRDARAGVIAPCAALDGHANATIFGGRRAIDWRDRPALARTVPATVVAIGRPPGGLVERVRRLADDSGALPLF